MKQTAVELIIELCKKQKPIARISATNIMKNIHVLPTEKPSKGYIIGECIKALSDVKIGQFVKTYYLMFDEEYFQPHNIYIISDEKFKDEDYFLHIAFNTVHTNGSEIDSQYCKKIILTTDQDLIKDGVQAIDDEFLEWFVKNSSCESVEVLEAPKLIKMIDNEFYKIIIPKEEPKQETLEEAAEKFAKNFGTEIDSTRYYAFINGAKWQAERMYNKEDMKKCWQEAQKLKITECMANGRDKKCYCTNEIHCQHKRLIKFSEWFEQFKNK